jgi:Domain of unknown function (DUF4160)
MPVIFRHRGIRVFFFSNEGDPREAVHVHAQRADCLAKIWLKPSVLVAESYGFNSAELKDLVSVIEDNAELIERGWNEHFG